MFGTNEGATTAGYGNTLMSANLMQSRSRFWGLSIGGKCVLQLAFFGFGLCIMGILPLAVASKFEGRAGSVNVPRVMGIIFLSVGLFFLVGGVICLLVIAKYAKHDPGGGRPAGNYAVVDLYANQPSVHYHTSGERLGNMQGPLEAASCPYGVSTIYAPSPDASQTSREESYNQPATRAPGSGYHSHSQYQPSTPIYVPYKSSPQRSLACSNPSAHYAVDETPTPDSPKPAIHVLRPPSYRTASNAPLTCTHSPPPAYSESRYNA